MADPAVLIRTYPRLLAARVRSDWQYRTSFFLLLFTSAAFTATEFVAVVVFFGNVDVLADWTLAETTVLYGMAGLSFSLADAFASQVEAVADHVKAGTFDRYLLRPVSPYVLLLGDEFAFRRLGKVVQAAAVLALGVFLLDASWSPTDVVVGLGAVVSGTVIFAAVWCITACLSFWTVDSKEVANAFTYGGNYATQYPADIYTGWLQRFLVFIVPLGFVAYLPLSWILDKPTALGLDPTWGFASPVVAAALCGVARATWRSGIRHYRSTGS